MELENKPANTPLRQQKMKAWSFKFNDRSRGIFYLLTGVVFIIMGALIVVASNSVIEHKIRYDDVNGCHPQGICSVVLDVKDHMDSDVFFYYEIDGMYQNHRDYTKSFSSKQLSGSDLSHGDISTYCDPITRNSDLDIIPEDLPADGVANPCGLIAKSFFTDNFTLYSLTTSSSITIDDSDIAFHKDKTDKFKKSHSNQT